MGKHPSILQPCVTVAGTEKPQPRTCIMSLNPQNTEVGVKKWSFSQAQIPRLNLNPSPSDCRAHTRPPRTRGAREERHGGAENLVEDELAGRAARIRSGCSRWVRGPRAPGSWGAASSVDMTFRALTGAGESRE